MSEIIVLDNVSQASEFFTGKTPAHPLVHIVNLNDIHIKDEVKGKRICTNLYALVMKNSACGQICYGREHCDFDSGVITAFAPGQVIQIEDSYQQGQLTGWALYFHPDFLHQHTLGNKIKQYGYFSYDVNEALHLSEREQRHLDRVITEIQHETQQNIDEFSADILMANIELILKYTDRYFNRQLLTRKPFYQDKVERFLQLLDQKISAENMDSHLPQVKELANEMHMSPNYMSDMLRKETGKSAQELIHLHLIQKAKYMLLNSDESIASISYKLGFEYPQYFNRIFKKKVDMTPLEFRTRH